MPIDCAMARLSTAARTIAPQRVRSTPNQSRKIKDRAENDEEDAVGREIPPEDVQLAAQVLGQEHRHRAVAVEQARERHRHEDEADAEEHLRELARGVEARVKKPLENTLRVQPTRMQESRR